MSTSVKLEQLKSLLEMVNLEDDDHRDSFRSQLDHLISDWTNDLPDLRDIFREHEIEWLLQDSIKNTDNDDEGVRFIEFVARSGYRDEPEVDKNGKPLLRRTTPLHHAAEYIKNNEEIFDTLFEVYDRYDVNYVNENGLSHFHIACLYGCDYVVENFLEHGQDPDFLWKETGVSALHLAVHYEHKKVVEVLLRHGANPNFINKKLLTPLHMVCLRDDDDDGTAKLFFEICDEVEVDARRYDVPTPLVCALLRGHVELIELLLRNGADPNLGDDHGETALHLLCRRGRKEGLLRLFFKVCADIGKTVRIDVANVHGVTPLQLALYTSNKETIEFLLRNGANPNLADNDGRTPLHIIIMSNDDVSLAKLFFEINDEMRQRVEVDPKDTFGRTPLQWAVADLSPDKVDILLERGADLSSFVFPTEGYFGARLKQGCCENWMVFKLRLAFGIMRIIKRLETSGYELLPSGRISIMKLFATYGLFKKSRDFEIFWTKNDECTRNAKRIMIIPNLSIYDLIQLRPQEAAKLLTFSDFFEFANSDKLGLLPEKHKDTCVVHLCEIISRRFFQSWALDCFWELIHYRLPLECCEMILEKLMNEDLYNICLAYILATNQRHEDDKKINTECNDTPDQI